MKASIELETCRAQRNIKAIRVFVDGKIVLQFGRRGWDSHKNSKHIAHFVKYYNFISNENLIALLFIVFSWFIAELGLFCLKFYIILLVP